MSKKTRTKSGHNNPTTSRRRRQERIERKKKWYRLYVKPVLLVRFDDGSYLRATRDHKCYTSLGWLTLEEALSSNTRFVGTGKSIPKTKEAKLFTRKELSSEQWRILPGYNGSCRRR